jgi:hypothetical protein
MAWDGMDIVSFGSQVAPWYETGGIPNQFVSHVGSEYSLDPPI